MEKVSLDFSREEELSEIVRSFPVLYDSSHEGLKEKDVVKNAWEGFGMALKFIQTGNYFCVNPSLLFQFLELSYSFGLTQ